MTVNYRETNTLLAVQSVHLHLGENHILDGVDLEIKDIEQPGTVRGQVRCILGPSGIGKTQLLRIIAGLNTPDEGSIMLAPDGINLTPVQPGMVGVVWQGYLLFDHLTVLENLMVAGKVSGHSKKEVRDRALNLLNRFSLGERRNFWPSQLSGGQRQRVSILQQIMVDRLFLIMDEPFSGLDPGLLHSVLEVVDELAVSHEAKTLIIITHDVRAAVRVADRIHILGRTVDEKEDLNRGAHFIREIDLVDRGIAWQEDVRQLPQFNETVNEIEDLFAKI